MRKPDVVGTFGSAWKMDWHDDRSALTTFWLVNGPTYHPSWEWWAILVIHLREVEGIASPYKQYPNATHEFQIVTLDPAHEVDIDALDKHEVPLSLMSPPDVVVQFGGVTDAQAAVVAASAAYMICSGCSPDEDFEEWWMGAVLRGAEQVRTGGFRMPVAVV